MSSITNQFIADKLNSKPYDDIVHIIDNLDSDTISLLHILTKPEPLQKRVDSWEMVEGDVFRIGSHCEWEKTRKEIGLGGRKIDYEVDYIGTKLRTFNIKKLGLSTKDDLIDICKNIVEKDINIQGFLVVEQEKGRNKGINVYFRSYECPTSVIVNVGRATKSHTSYVINR